MCGRFTLRTPVEKLMAAFGLEDLPELPLRYNIAPTQPVATVLVVTGGREFRPMRWGLIPSWAKDQKIGSRLINARSETVAEKPAFRSAFRHRRCLILADGFYEWQRTDVGRLPYYIARRDGEPFAFAGLWERWAPPTGEPVESCTILTTAANSLIAEFHLRMPVILDPADHDLWLDETVTDPALLQPLLKRYPPEKMVAYRVGPAVNRPANDSPDLIRPLSGEEVSSAGPLF